VPEETKMFGIPNHDCFLAMDLIAIVGLSTAYLQFLENVEQSKRHADESKMNCQLLIVVHEEGKAFSSSSTSCSTGLVVGYKSNVPHLSTEFNLLECPQSTSDD